MKVLKIKIENYKKISIFEVDINGDNMRVAGKTAQGKTTAISALWDIIEKTGTVKQGEIKGRISITLGDEEKTVMAERTVTDSSSHAIIMTSDGGKISVKDFKEWFHSLGIDPHKIMEMKPTEKTQLLLSCLQLPDGVNLADMDFLKERLSNERLDIDREKRRLQGVAQKEPEKVERVSVAEKSKELEAIRDHNNKVAKAKEICESVETELSKTNDKIKELLEVKTNLEDRKILGERYLESNKITDTSEIIKQIQTAEENNKKANEYENWQKVKKEYDEASKKYDEVEVKIKKIEIDKKTALDQSKTPLEGLTVEKGNIIYNGIEIENLGKSEQLLICSILACEKIKNSKIKVVRLDGIESMSTEDYINLEKIFNENGVQVFSSRVARNDIEENEIEIVEGKIFSENNS